MYKLVAVDLDGTLLDSSRQVSARNRQAIKDMLDAGRIFSISTGRPLQGITTFIDMIGADLPVIIYNGAMAITSKTKTILHECAMEGAPAEAVVRFGREHGTNVFVYAGGELYVAEINQPVKDYMKVIGIAPNVTHDLSKIAAKGVTKVLFRDTPDKIAALQNAIKPHFEGKVNYFTSWPNLLEFVNINTSKGVAMQKIGEHYGIAQTEMMAIGDSYNDADMIRYAALGVAMGNAPQQIKDIADAVTSTNDEDGVAEAIYRYVLI